MSAEKWFYGLPKWLRWVIASPILLIGAPVLGLLIVMAKAGDWANATLSKFQKL